MTRFLPNMDAMLCRIDMHTGDLDAADAWYREKAPREPTHLNVMRRYQYLTQAMVELEDGRPDTVQLTLDFYVDMLKKIKHQEMLYVKLDLNIEEKVNLQALMEKEILKVKNIFWKDRRDK